MLYFVRGLLPFAHEQLIFGCSFGSLSQFARGLAFRPDVKTTFSENMQEICDCQRSRFSNLVFSGQIPPFEGQNRRFVPSAICRGIPNRNFLANLTEILFLAFVLWAFLR